MHILLTGATGFIGSILCERLLDQGLKVTGLARSPRKETLSKSKRLRRSEELQLISCDITKADLTKEVFTKLEHVDAIIHLAGQPYKRKSLGPSTYFENNFLGTLNILECSRMFDIRKFIFASSFSVYGLGVGQNVPKRLPVNELHPVTPFDFYDASKFYAEEICKFYHCRFSTALRVLRYSKIYGPRLHEGVVYEMIRKALSDEPIEVFGDISTDFVYIHDVVDVTLNSLDKLSGYEIFNIGGGREVNLNYLCSKIVELTHSRSKIISHDQPKGRLFLDISKARKYLHYQPIALDEGLRQCIEYVKKKTAP
jgi:nucleoside-diphosphate-sugar epimerase